MTITMTTHSRIFFVRSFKCLPSRATGPELKDWGHATPSKNPSPAGKPQNRAPEKANGRQIAGRSCWRADRYELEVGALGLFDAARRVWFQDIPAQCQTTPRGPATSTIAPHGTLRTTAKVSARPRPPTESRPPRGPARHDTRRDRRSEARPPRSRTHQGEVPGRGTRCARHRARRTSHCDRERPRATHRPYGPLLQTPKRQARNCDPRRIKSRIHWPIYSHGARIARRE